MNHAMIFEQILSRVEAMAAEHPSVQWALDELVTDVFEAKASDVNNSGVQEQLMILLQTMSPEELFRLLNFPPNTDR